MICKKCYHDLARCTCEDLEARFNSILESGFILIGEEYQQRIRAQIKRNKLEQSKNE